MPKRQNTERTSPERKCPYCREAVRRTAKKCPHCGASIDPRFPGTGLDDNAYRHARNLVLQDVKEEVLSWASFRLKVITALLAIVVPLGAFSFVQLTTKQAINSAAENKFSVTLREIREELATLTQDITLINRRLAKANSAHDGFVKTNDLNAVAENINALSARIDDTQRRIDETDKTAQQLDRQLKTELEAMIDQTSSRLSPREPRLILKSPSSLRNERPRVFYQSEEQAILFRWNWIAEQGRNGTNALLYSLKCSPSPDFEAAGTFETNTVLNSLKIPFKDLIAGMPPGAKPAQGRYYWQVTASENAASPPIISSQIGSFEVYSNAIDRIRATGEIRVGITAQESKPFVRHLTGYDLRLMAVDQPGEIPSRGDSLVIVAKHGADAALHFRIFNADGHIILDGDETEVRGDRTELARFKQELGDAWDRETLTADRKAALIGRVASITGQTQIRHRARLGGFDIHIVQQLANNLPAELDWNGDVQPIYRQYDWIPLLNAPRNNEVDLIISSITIKSERTNAFGINFSDSYHTTVQSALFTPEDPANVGRKIRNLDFSKGEKLEGVRLVAQKGTTGLAAAKMLAAETADLTILESLNEVVNSLQEGNADVAIHDLPIALDERRRRPETFEVLSLRQLGSEISPNYWQTMSDEDKSNFIDHYGIAMEKGQESLLRTVNDCLDRLRESDLQKSRRNFGL